MKIFLLTIFLIASCNLTTQQNPNIVVVEGYIKGFKPDQIYLANGFEWEKFLDSSKVTDGSFKFLIDNTEKDLLSQASLEYIGENGQIKTFEFKNDILSNKASNYFQGSFIPDSAIIKISGDLSKSPYLSISAGMETRALFTTQVMDFGFLDANSKNREERYNSFIQIIKKFPSSAYLLNSIYSSKSGYTKEELLQVINTFNKNIRNTVQGKKLLAYALNKPNGPEQIQNFVFIDNKDKPQHIYETAASLNMIVLWASWCGPCRAEIPGLKEIYAKFQDKGLNVVSISVDDDKSSWLKAVQVEDMKWTQLVVDSSQKNMFYNTIDFDNIPVVIFADSTGKQVKRFVGYTNNAKSDYEETINLYLPH